MSVLYQISTYIIPLLIFVAILLGFYKKVLVFEVFREGVLDGFSTLLSIAPSIFGLVIAINMFKSSGALSVLVDSLSPISNCIKFPKDLLPFALMRPISGSGSIAIATDLFKTYHPDSLIGTMASVMMGSTDTSLYVIAIYFGSTSIKNTRYTIKSAILAELTSMFLSIFLVRKLFGI